MENVVENATARPWGKTLQAVANRSEYRYMLIRMSNLEPAATIIQRLGGAGIVAGVVSVHRTRVSNWKRPREQGGTGGLIPQKHHRPLLDFAAQNAIELKAEDFLAPVVQGVASR